MKQSQEVVGGQWDYLVRQLEDQRRTAGNPSFSRITDLIVQRRIEAGQTPDAARLARSTLYDTFRRGRPRMNLDLAREAALVLGANDEDVNLWIKTCKSPAAPLNGAVEVPEREPSVRETAFLMIACVALNMLGREFVDFFKFPIHLDMVGTAVAAIALGPWRGAAVGATTNVVGIIGSGLVSLPFALVNVVGALIWGYGVRNWRMGTTLVRFFLLNLLTATVCTLVAVPLVLAVLNGQDRVGHDAFAELSENVFHSLAAAITFANWIVSVLDKLISGFVALVLVSALPFHLRHKIPLILADHRPARGGE